MTFSAAHFLIKINELASLSNNVRFFSSLTQFIKLHFRKYLHKWVLTQFTYVLFLFYLYKLILRLYLMYMIRQHGRLFGGSLGEGAAKIGMNNFPTHYIIYCNHIAHPPRLYPPVLYKLLSNDNENGMQSSVNNVEKYQLWQMLRRVG